MLVFFLFSCSGDSRVLLEIHCTSSTASDDSPPLITVRFTVKIAAIEMETQVVALYEFVAQPNSGEISIKPNEIIKGL